MDFMLVLGSFWAPFLIHFAIQISLKNVLQISLIFLSILEWILAPFRLQFGSQNWSKIDPGRPWGKGSLQKHACTKMEPKLSPGLSKSSLRVPQGSQSRLCDLSSLIMWKSNYPVVWCIHTYIANFCWFVLQNLQLFSKNLPSGPPNSNSWGNPTKFWWKSNYKLVWTCTRVVWLN